MLTGYTEFKNISNKREINFVDKRFNRFVNTLNIQLINNQDNYDEEKYNSIKQSQDIVIDCFEDAKQNYFVICFNEILIIIEQCHQNFIKKLFTGVDESKIFIFNEARNNFLKISGIDESKINTNQESLETFNTEYESFKYEFSLPNIYKLNIKKFWTLIKRCVSGLLIKKAYSNCNINRTHHFLLNFDKPNQEKQFKSNEFIKLRNICNTETSLIYLVYHFELEQILCIKSHKAQKNQEREIENYKKLNFPFISRYFGTTIIDYQKSNMIEYINGSTLLDIEKDLTIKNKIEILIQIINTILYLHSLNLIYRDLKPNNIIIDKQKTAVLIDFDQMIDMNRTDIDKTDDFTRYFATIFAAPEICDGNVRPSFKTDIYSIGMMIYFLFSDNKTEIKNDDFKKQYPKLYQIYEKCICYDAENRPTADKLTVLLKDYIYESHDKELFSNETPETINDLKSYIYFCSIISKIFITVTLVNNENDPNSQNDLGIMYSEGIFIPRDINKAIKYLTLSADQNNSIAQYNIGEIYYEAKFNHQDIQKAIDYFLLSANQNYSPAQFKLGVIYYDDKLVPKNIEKAIYYFKLAAEQNNLDALNNLGAIYEDIDLSKSFDYFNRAIKQNDPNALFNVGYLYYLGNHVKKDIEKAIHYFQLAADRNSIHALYTLGLIYTEGTDIEPDVNKAIHYYSIASDLNDAESQVNLACIYFYGELIQQDIRKAIEYFTLAANQNCAEAQYNLGIIYSNNKHVHCDIEKSILFFTLAANQNHPSAQYNLGAIYLNGVHIQKDVNKGIHYLTLAANNNLPNAQYFLGWIYFSGVDVIKDIKKAFHYLTLSANQNYADAQFELGYFYYEAKYLPRDMKKAIHLLTLAANQNHVRAQYELGLIYLYGKHAKYDIEKAISYFTKAAKQDHLKAIINLGIIYSQCKDIPHDFDKAIYYFKIASDRNNAKSQFLLGSIYFQEPKEFDINKSIHFMTLAADQNHMDAQNFLGALYLDGKCVERDINKAIHYLTLAANNHSIAAQKNLGFLYLENKYVERDMNKAIHYLTLAASSNLACCQSMLGILYLRGKLVPQNIEKALDYLNHSVKLNDHLGQKALGDVYLEGKYVNRDVKKAIYLYKEASITSDSLTKNNLAVIYKNGFNAVNKNINLAKEYLEESIKNDCPLSMFNLSKIYYDEEEKNGVKDHFKSIDLLIKSSEMGFNPSIIFIIFIWAKRFKFINPVLIENELKKHQCKSTKLINQLYENYVLLVSLPPQINIFNEIKKFIESNDVIAIHSDVIYTSKLLNEASPKVVQKMLKIDKNFIEGFGFD